VLRFIASILAAIGLASPASAGPTAVEEVVAFFDAAMHAAKKLEDMEQLAASKGFRVLNREVVDGYVSYLETVDPSGDLYLVGIRDHRETLKSDNIRVLVTQYETDADYYDALAQAAKNALPNGPTQDVDLTGGFDEGTAWEAGYPDLITLNVKYHRGERASLIEAHLFKIN